jgi:acyl-CoA thioesterase FadM
MEEYRFSTKLTVRMSDINHANHLDNARLVALVNEARVHFLEHLSLSEADLGDGKTGMVIGDLAVQFRAEAFYGDELIFDMDADELTDKSFRLKCRVRKGDTVVAFSETGIVAFDYRKRSVVSLPGAFMDRVNNMETVHVS